MTVSIKVVKRKNSFEPSLLQKVLSKSSFYTLLASLEGVEQSLLLFDAKNWFDRLVTRIQPNHRKA